MLNLKRVWKVALIAATSFMLGAVAYSALHDVIFPTYVYPPNERLIAEGGMVRNEVTARKIAEAVIMQFYGKDSLEYGLIAEYDSFLEAWVVEGTLPANYLGGVPRVVIQKKDGKIMELSHSK